MCLWVGLANTCGVGGFGLQNRKPSVASLVLVVGMQTKV